MSEANREQDFSAMIEASAEAAKQELAESGVVSQGHEPIKPNEMAFTPAERAHLDEMGKADLAKAMTAVEEAADERKAPSQSGIYEIAPREDESRRTA
jgi:hypothetical protein